MVCQREGKDLMEWEWVRRWERRWVIWSRVWGGVGCDGGGEAAVGCIWALVGAWRRRRGEEGG